MVRAAILGASGGIGQALALLLKSQLPAGSSLLLYDVAGVFGVAADLAHIDTQVKIEWAQGSIPSKPNCPELKRLMKDADIVIITAGIAVVKGQDKDKHALNRQELFDINANIIMDLVTTTASVSADACYMIVSNPVNSLVPIVAESLKKMGKYNKNKLFGITSLDVMRATTFLNEIRDPVHHHWITVVGAHSGPTIVPLFSQTRGAPLSEAETSAMIVRVQNAGNEVLKAKQFKGTATLSIAYATAKFALKVVRGLRGDYSEITCAFVDTDGGDYPAPYMAIPIALGPGGIAARLPIGPLSHVESQYLTEGLPELLANIEAGNKWVHSKL
jgi:malate dehydrogenase